MLRQIIHRGLLTGMLLMSLTPLVHARSHAGGDASNTPVSQGLVLTIVAIDPKTDTATLRADDGGQEFQLTTSTSWKVGHKVECDLLDIHPGPQLQHCQPW